MGKVSCEETKVEKTKEMNDRDYLVDLLASEKDVTKNMCIALTEASNNNLEEELYDIFNTVLDIQSETYEMAWNYGWYKLEEAESTKINQKLKDFDRKISEFEN